MISGPKIRTVFLLQDLKFGGTQTQALALARHLPPDRFAVEIWTLMGGDELEAAPLPVLRLGKRNRVSVGSLHALWRRVRQVRPDLLVLWTVVPNIWGRIFGRICRIPAIVGNCRDGPAPRRQHERLLWRLAHGIVCNSNSQRDELIHYLGVPPSRVTVVHNGVDIERFSPGPRAGRARLLCVARLVPKKDHGTLIKAFERLLMRRPDARLQLVGSGPLENGLRRMARTLPQDAVEWLGARMDLVPLYRECAMLVLSSRAEGLPNAVLEAMACARPVVATAVDGVPEVLENGRTGFLVPPGRPEKLAEAMEAVLADPERATAMGLAGRDKVAQYFSMDAMKRGYEHVFSTVALDPI